VVFQWCAYLLLQRDHQTDAVLTAGLYSIYVNKRDIPTALIVLLSVLMFLLQKDHQTDAVLTAGLCYECCRDVPLVTVVSQWCCSGATVVSQRRYSGVTMVLQWCLRGTFL
jgi:hypothetical protein